MGYRDPAGAISPDGRWIAYAEGRFPARASGRRRAQRRPARRPRRRSGTSPGALTAGRSWPTASAAPTAGRSTTVRPAPARRCGPTTIRSRRGSRAAARDGHREGVRPASARVVARRPVHRRHRERPRRAGTVDDLRRRIARAGARASRCASAPRRGRRAARSRASRPLTAGRASRARAAARVLRTDPDLDVYGPFAFALDGATVYALAREMRRAPSICGPRRSAADAHAGSRRSRATPTPLRSPPIAASPSRCRATARWWRSPPRNGGASRPLATFQSETPSWDPTGRFLGITYGTWRRLPDDAKYPDIAQESRHHRGRSGSAGGRAIEHRPYSRTPRIRRCCWSPKRPLDRVPLAQDQSDDVWLQAAGAAGDTTARRISFLGRGAEVGWPRWSPDGRWLLFEARQPRHPQVDRVHRRRRPGVGRRDPSAAGGGGPRVRSRRGGGRATPSGCPTARAWSIVAKEGPGRHLIFTVPRDGGDAQVVHRFASGARHAGHSALSPDGRDVAFIAPASDGFFQVFRAADRRRPQALQVTRDPSHKTQPAWSPDGETDRVHGVELRRAVLENAREAVNLTAAKTTCRSRRRVRRARRGNRRFAGF